MRAVVTIAKALSDENRVRILTILDGRKHGRWMYYRLADEHVRHVFGDGLRHTSEVEAEQRGSILA